MVQTGHVRVGLVQFSAGLDRSANLEALAAQLRAFGAPGPQLVVCPEASMYDFGPTDAPLAPHAESLDGPFVAALGELAREHGCTIVAGMFEGDGQRLPYNTLVVVGPDGAVRTAYRKLHLYDAFGYAESDRMAAGDGPPVTFDLGEHRVGLLTCYDLRFPELARALAADGADLLVVPAAWVRGPLKEDHWSTLLRARAIENTCYVAAAAQCGRQYCGNSALIDPLGVVVSSLGEQTGHCQGEVRVDRIAEVRERNPTLRHRRFAVARTSEPPDERPDGPSGRVSPERAATVTADPAAGGSNAGTSGESTGTGVAGT